MMKWCFNFLIHYHGLISSVWFVRKHGTHTASPTPWTDESVCNVRLYLHWKSRFICFIPWPVLKSVEKKGVEKCMISQHPVTLISVGHGIKACQLSNCQSPRNQESAGLVIPGPQQLLHWELCDFSMGMGSWDVRWLWLIINVAWDAAVEFVKCYWSGTKYCFIPSMSRNGKKVVSLCSVYNASSNEHSFSVPASASI